MTILCASVAILALLVQLLNLPAVTATTDDNGATSRVAALPELWTIIALHCGLVGDWRLMGVCRAVREGAKAWLRTLQKFVVCGGYGDPYGDPDVEAMREVRRLDLGDLQWEHSVSLAVGRYCHACCVVRGSLVVLGGQTVSRASGDDAGRNTYPCIDRVEIVRHPGSESQEEGALPCLSCDGHGHLATSIALAITESESDKGQVLHIGGWNGGYWDAATTTAALQTLDLATGVCTPQKPLLCNRSGFAAARLPDGRAVCAGGFGVDDDDENECRMVIDSAEVFGPVPHGSKDAASWEWRKLPHMSISRSDCGGCVLSDGRFAAFGSDVMLMENHMSTETCEALTLDDNERWEALPPMPEPRAGFTCASVGGCVIVAGGAGDQHSEDVTPVILYEETLER